VVEEKERRRITRDRLLDMGFSPYFVARYEGVSPQALYKYAKARGYPVQPIRWQREAREYNPHYLLNERVEIEVDFKPLSFLSETDAGKERRHSRYQACWVTLIGEEEIWGYSDEFIARGRGEPSHLALLALTDAIERGILERVKEPIVLIDRYFKKLIKRLEEAGWKVTVVPRWKRIRYYEEGLITDKRYVIFRSVERKIAHIASQCYPTTKLHRQILRYPRVHRAQYPREYHDLVRSVWRAVLALHWKNAFGEPIEEVDYWINRTEGLLQKMIELRSKEKKKIKMPVPAQQ